MALSDKDHLEALRNRLHNKILEQERKLQDETAKLEELRALHQTLQEAPKIMEGIPVGREARPQPRDGKKTQPAKSGRNENFKELLMEYVKKARDGKLETAKVMQWMRERGIQGANHSVSTYIHVALKKEDFRKAGVVWHKGLGFYKGCLVAKAACDNCGASPAELDGCSAKTVSTDKGTPEGMA